MGGQGHAAVRDRDVDALGAGEAAHDGLAVERQRADADLELHDPGVVEAADRAAGTVEEFIGPAAQVGFWRVQVHGGRGVLGLQVQQAAGVRAQGEVRVWTSRTRPGGVTGPTRTTSPGAAEPLVRQGTSGTGARSGVQRPAQQITSSASSTAPAAVRILGEASGLLSRPVTRPGSPVRTSAPLAFRVRDQAGDQRFGQDVALVRKERGRGAGSRSAGSSSAASTGLTRRAG